MNKTGKIKIFKPQHHLLLIVIPIENENKITNNGLEIPEGYSIINIFIIPKYKPTEKNSSITYIINERKVFVDGYIDENKKQIYPYPGKIKH